jgi:hypothetical protein
MVKFRELSQDEIAQAKNDIITDIPEINSSPLRGAYYQQIGKTQAKVLARKNLADTAGIDPKLITDDQSEKFIEDEIHKQVVDSDQWDNLAYELPVLSKTMSDPDTMAATLPVGDKMGFLESVVTGFSKKSLYNELESRINKHAFTAMDSKSSNARRMDAAKKILEMSKAQADAGPVPGWSLPYMGFFVGQTGRYLTDLSKAAVGGFKQGLREAPEFAIRGAGYGAMGGGAATAAAGGLGAIPGAAVGGVLGAAVKPVEKTIAGMFGYNQKMNTAMFYRTAIEEGLSPTPELASVSERVGTTLALVEQVLDLGLIGEFAGGFKKAVFSSSMRPALKKIMDQVPASKLAIKEILKNESKYIGKPLTQAIGKATLSAFKQNAAIGGTQYVQNFIMNTALNKQFINNGMSDKVMDWGDIATKSLQGVPEAMIGATPFTAITAGLHGVGTFNEITRNNADNIQTVNYITEAIKQNDLHEKAPDLAKKFVRDLSDETGVKHISIDIKDAEGQLLKRGITAEAAFKNAGLEVYYQKSIDEGDNYAHIPIEDWDNAVKNQIHEDGTFTDLVVDAYRIGEDTFTGNKEKEIQRTVKDWESDVESVIDENRVRLDEIKEIIKSQLKTGLQRTGRTARQIEAESEANSELTVRMIARLSMESGESVENIQQMMVPVIIGPGHIDGQNKSAVRSRISDVVMEYAKSDAGHVVGNNRRAGKKIYIPQENFNDFKDAISNYPKGSFTQKQGDGIPWEFFASENFDIDDMNDFIDKLESGKFHTNQDLASEINRQVSEEIEYNKQFLPGMEAGTKLGSVEFGEYDKTIHLFKNANQSTFMHEMSHVFLQSKFDLIKNGLGSEEFISDWSILSDWLGILPDQEKLTEKQQESFARSFESYLKDGKAPSLELRRVFQQFRRWMTQIYSELKKYAFSKEIFKKESPDKDVASLRKDGWIIDKEMGINISPEMRGVFDRMLATQNEIDLVKSESGRADNFNAMRKAGVSSIVINRLRRYSEAGEEKAFRRLMNAQMNELDVSFQNARKKFIKSQYDESKQGTVANEIFTGLTPYSYIDKWAKGKKGIENRDDAHNEFMRLAFGVLSGEEDTQQLMGIEAYFNTKTILEAAEKALNTEVPSKYLDSQIELAAQEKYPHLMDSAEFYDRALEAFHNIDQLTALIAESEVLKSAGELPDELTILKGIEIPELKAENIDKIKQMKAEVTDKIRKRLSDKFKSESEKLKWEKDQAVKLMMYSRLFDELELRTKYDEKELRAKTEKLYERLFEQSLRQQIKKNNADLKNEALLIKESAKRIVGKMPISELLSSVRTLITAERNHAVMAMKHTRDLDPEKAYESKREQIKAHAKLGEAIKAKKQFENGMKRIDIARKLTKKQMKRQVHLDAMVDILSRFGIDQKEKDSLSTGTYLSWVAEYGDNLDLPEWLMTDPGRDIKSLNIQEFNDLVDVVRSIQHFANLENKFMRAEKWVEIKDIIDEMKEFSTTKGKLKIKKTLMSDEQKRQDAGYLRSFPSVAINSWKSLAFNVDQLSQAMGANVPVNKNPFFQYLLQSLRDCTDNFEKLYDDYSVRLERRILGLDTKKMMNTFTKYEWEPGRPISELGIFGIAHHIGNESNMKRMVDGFSAQFGEHWTEDYIRSMVEKHVTPEMMDRIQEYWNINEEIFPLVGELYERIEGFAPTKIKAKSFDFNGKRYDGGYAPLMLARGFTRMIFGEEQSIADYSAYHTMTGNGFTNKRAAYAQYVIETDVEAMHRHVGLVLRDLTYRETLLSLNRLFNVQDFKDIWVSKHGEEGYKNLKQYLQYIATNGLSANDSISRWEKSVDVLMKASTVGTMAWNLRMAVGDLTSFLFIAPHKVGFLGALRMIPTISKVAIDATVRSATDLSDIVTRSQNLILDNPDRFNDTVSMVERKSQFMKTRFKNKYVDLHDYIMKGTQGSKLTNNLMFGVFHWVQMMTEIPMWNEVYSRALKTMPESEAIKFADANVAQVFTSARLEDRPALLRQTTGLRRALNMFSSWMYQQSGNLYVEAEKFKQGTFIQKINALSFITAFLLIQPALSAFMSGSRPKEDEELLRWVAYEDLNFVGRMVPIFGPIGSKMLASKITGHPDPFSKLNYTSAFRGFESSINAIGKQLDKDQDIPDKLEAWSDAMAFMPKIPWTTQTHMMLWNTVDILNGNMQFEINDVLKRRAKSERD